MRALAGLPAFWIALAVEASNDHDPMLLNLKEYSVGETAYSSTTPPAVDDRELQWGFLRWLQLPRRSIGQRLRQAVRVYPHTICGHLLSLSSLLASTRPAGSRLFEQPRPNLLPRDHIGRILFMSGNAEIKFCALRLGQRQRIRVQAFPHRVEQFHFFRCG